MTERPYGRVAGIVVVVFALLLTGVRWAQAGPLYGATGSNGVNGELVILDPSTGGVLTDIGPLVDVNNGAPYAITGIAFQPGTGGSVLFGSTANLSATAPGHLVRIDPGTAKVSDVGSFGLPNGSMSDIVFDSTSGVLYGNSGKTGNFYTIDLTTGAATSLGPTGQGSTIGGGLAANAAETIFGSPNGSSDLLFTYDKATGAATAVVLLSGAPFAGFNAGINAMAFDSADRLFGVNNNQGQPSKTHLVMIDPATGAITDIGTSLDNLDAIAFQPPLARVPVPALSPFGKALLVFVVFLSGLILLRRRRSQGG